MRLVDHTGKKFGRLTVLYRGEKKLNDSKVYWVCKCDCGNIVSKSAIYLTKTDVPSCGCYKREHLSELKLDDLTGKRFGRLTVLYRANTVGEMAKWHCKCDCGNEVDVFAGNLKKGNHSTSCGCYQNERRIESHTTHGYSNTRIYQVYCKIKDRCNCKNNPSYYRYGARGIKMCPEWENDPEVFCKWAYANGYREDAEFGETTIDRRDNNKGYSPDNCRIIPLKEQCNNRSTNIFFEHKGIRKTLAQWRDMFGLTQWQAYKYLVLRNYTIQDLIDRGIVKNDAFSI